MREMSRLLTISQAADASGLSPDTIRYYERVGVLPRIQRAGNGYRGYPPEHLEPLRFARSLRDLGLAPAAMSDLIRIFHDGTCRQMRSALLETGQSTLDRVREQRVALERVEAQLAAVLSAIEGKPVDNHHISSL